jgi:hypothetical protein
LQDILFNIQTGTGLLVAKLKNSRVKVRKLATDDVEAFGEAEINVSLYSNPEEDVQFLKNAVLPLQLEAVKVRLIRSFSHRRQLLSQSNDVHIRRDYPYFFKCPELVRFHFDPIKMVEF